jgi:thymidylate synthase ThyX
MESMAIAGAGPLGDYVDRYVIYDDGTTGHLQVPDGLEPTLSRPGRVVSRDAYSDRLGELQAATAAHVAALEAGDQARHETDYAALLGAGVPEETARRMSGLGQAGHGRH